LIDCHYLVHNEPFIIILWW